MDFYGILNPLNFKISKSFCHVFRNLHDDITLSFLLPKTIVASLNNVG